MKSLDRVANDEKQTQKRLHTRRERQARDNYKQLLQEMVKQGKLAAGTKWKDLHPLVENDERYISLLGLPGSTPLELFWDALEGENQKSRHIRNTAMDVLEDHRYEMTTETALDDFVNIMRSDPRTSNLDNSQLKMIFGKLMEKIKRRADAEREETEKIERKAVDSLRSSIKHMRPSIRVDDRVRRRITTTRSFT